MSRIWGTFHLRGFSFCLSVMLVDRVSKGRCVVEARVINRATLISRERKMMVTDIESLFVDALAVLGYCLRRGRGSVLISIGVILHID